MNLISKYVIIIGAQGTGKTTLQKALHDFQLPKVEATSILIRSSVRRLINDGSIKYDPKLGIGRDGQLLAMSTTFGEVLTELKKDNVDFVIDTESLLSNLAYIRLYLGEANILNGIGETWLNYILNNFKYYVLYLPPEFPPEQDGVRSSNLNFQLKNDKEIRKLFKKFKLENSIYIVKGTVKERVNYCLGILYDSFQGKKS